MRTLLIAAWIALPGLALAQSQTVWRCGADGRSFSDTPCAAGQATVYAVARPDAELESARARARREQKLADQLSRERQQREAAARGTGYSGMPLPQATVKAAAQPVAKHKRKQHQPHALQPEDGGTFRAAVPASPRRKG